MTRDFAGQSTFFVDEFAGNNVVRHLDDLLAGAESPFATTSGEAADLAFGGPTGPEHVLFLSAAFPPAPYSVAVMDAVGAVAARSPPPLDAPGGRSACCRRRSGGGSTRASGRYWHSSRRGLPNKEIAAALACAERTVEVHVTSVVRKAGCECRAALAARLWAVAH